MLTYIGRKLGYRPKYIATYEFQQNGRLHLHVLFFGVTWLMSQKKLSFLCKNKFGQGKCVYLYVVRNDHGTWKSAKKMKSGDYRDDIGAYLMKPMTAYLNDVSNHRHVILYWVFNTRFFSASRNLERCL